MKFRNTTSGPIYVQTFLTGKKFHVRLYGVEPVKENVIVQSKVLSRKNGTRSEAYRVVETGSGSKREFLSRDYYKPSAH
jgi:vancomycin resistance protein YoaR